MSEAFDGINLYTGFENTGFDLRMLKGRFGQRTKYWHKSHSVFRRTTLEE